MKILLSVALLLSFSVGFAQQTSQQVRVPQTLSAEQIANVQQQARDTVAQFGANLNGVSQTYVVPQGQLSDEQRTNINQQAVDTANFAKRYYPQQ